MEKCVWNHVKNILKHRIEHLERITTVPRSYLFDTTIRVMDISGYHFDSGGEIDYYQWSHSVGFSNSNVVLVSNHRLSIRRISKENKFVYQTYRRFLDKSEEMIFEGDLSSAVAYANSQTIIFHKNMPPKKYIPGPDTYAELGRIGFTS